MARNEQRNTTWVMIVSAFISTFMSSSLNLAVPGMGAYFNVSAAAIGWIITAYILTTTALSVPFGKIADTTGRRRIFLLGVILFSLSCFGSAMAESFPIMMVMRCVQGVGASMLFATNTAIIVSVYPATERGKAIGRLLAGTYTGLSAGPVAGGILTHALGWRSIFIAAGVAGLISFIIAVRNLPRRESLTQEISRDAGGNILYILMIVLFIYGFTSIGEIKPAPLILLAGIAAGFGFVFTELKSDNPVVDVRIFAGNPAYTLSNLAALLNYGSTFAIGYLLSIYLQVIMGYSSMIAGIILVAQPVVMAVLTPRVGQLSDRVAPYKLATAGMLICTGCLIFYAFLGLHTHLAAIIISLIITGFGFSVFSSPNMNAIMSYVDKKDYSVASSILATMRTLGQSSSMSILTIIVGIFLGNSALADAEPQQLLHTMKICFIVFAVICFVGALFSLKRRDS
ncbi:MAG: MFS transporter [Anaerovoracaceae bacterium]|jgi:EmrB/QacA subfamily drug resistance transporter